MTDRHLPVRPDPARLEAEAEGLDGAARDELARSYGVESWERLVLACRVTHAIWRDAAADLEALIEQHPHLLHESARGAPGNWGPPMSYAANLGRTELVGLLHGRGATDLTHAFDRACLQGKIETARLLHDLGARPGPGAVMGPAETQSGAGMAFLLGLGAEVSDEHGDPLAPVALLFETYCRDPAGKHRCLELFVEHGVALPDTPPMAVHRGRIDLLEAHLARDPGLLQRTFTHREIYPPELGCNADESLALHGTPLADGTLLHLCVDFDELEIARWLLDAGADPDAPAAVDKEGFGGHTALFGTIVSQPYRVGLRRDDTFAGLLLEHGAAPDRRASLRKRLRFVEDESMHEYRDVTPLEWGERFHDPSWVNRSAMARIAAYDARAPGELRSD